MTNANLEVAINIASIGLPILPCTLDKRATLSDWPNKASTDPARLNEWFARGDRAPAINLGATNLVVVDLDNHEGRANGVESFKKLLKQNGAITKNWVIVSTPNKGFHIYFLQPSSGERISNSAGKFAPGVDIRGDGGYILAPNASLGQGKVYRTTPDHPDLIEAYKAGAIPELPEWIAAPLQRPKLQETVTGNPPSDKYARAAFEGEYGRVATAPLGQRNDTLNNAAFSLGQFIPSSALTRPEVESGLLRAALAAGLDKNEALATINSGMNEGMRHPRIVPDHKMERNNGIPSNQEEWAEPLKLPSGLLPVDDFNLQFLPQQIAPWVGDISDRMQCPADFVGVSAMVALGAILGRKIAIRPQQKTDWYEVPNLWGMVVGRPGMMKSPAMQEALKPLHRIESKAREAYEESVKNYNLVSEVFKLEKANAYKEAAKKGSDIQSLLSELIEPKAPIDLRYIVNDTSYERLGEVMADNPNGILAFRDEMVSLLKTLDREEYAAARGFYLSAWNGTGSYTFDRITRGKKYIEAACLSFLGSTQPGRLAEYVRRATNGGSGDDGLIQRFGLLVWPDQSPEWKEIDRYPDTQARHDAIKTFEGFEGLLPEDILAQREEYGALPYLRFDNTAQSIFNEWRCDLEKRLREEGISPSMESHLAKYRKLIPSLALINHLADGNKGLICENAILRALAFSEYLESHASRVYSAGIQSEVAAANAILKKIRQSELKDGFTLRNIHQHGWSHLTDRDSVKSGLDLLIDHDWLAIKVEQTGGRSKISYAINPRGLQ